VSGFYVGGYSVRIGKVQFINSYIFLNFKEFFTCVCSTRAGPASRMAPCRSWSPLAPPLCSSSARRTGTRTWRTWPLCRGSRRGRTSPACCWKPQVGHLVGTFVFFSFRSGFLGAPFWAHIYTVPPKFLLHDTLSQ